MEVVRDGGSRSRFPGELEEIRRRALLLTLFKSPQFPGSVQGGRGSVSGLIRRDVAATYEKDKATFVFSESAALKHPWKVGRWILNVGVSGANTALVPRGIEISGVHVREGGGECYGAHVGELARHSFEGGQPSMKTRPCRVSLVGELADLWWIYLWVDIPV